PVPAGAQVADTTPVLQADLTRLLGADPPPRTAEGEEAAPPPDARFTLIGVVAPRQVGAAPSGSGEGVALIAIDGQTPRAYRLGAQVDGDTVLQAVHARGAELGPRGGPARVALELPPPAPAATGTLPGLDTGATPGTAPPRPAAAPAARLPAPVPPFARPGAVRQPGNPNLQDPQPAPAQTDGMPQRGQSPNATLK
ncbi:MAG: putative ral secretion pathway protein GspC, partial [Pseudomonadota bacterium]